MKERHTCSCISLLFTHTYVYMHGTCKQESKLAAASYTHSIRVRTLVLQLLVQCAKGSNRVTAGTPNCQHRTGLGCRFPVWAQLPLHVSLAIAPHAFGLSRTRTQHSGVLWIQFASAWLCVALSFRCLDRVSGGGGKLSTDLANDPYMWAGLRCHTHATH